MAEPVISLRPAPLAEILERGLAGEPLGELDAIRLIECSEAELPSVLHAAAEMRDRGKGHEITYSRKVFLPVTNLCRDRCTYCTFRKDPTDPAAWTMTLSQIAQWSQRGRELGCKEALMCLGDKPELAFREYRELLAARGAHSTIDYVAFACVAAIEQGLLPHTNAGIMTGEEISKLRPLNASMGLMLENISPRLRQRGGVHQWAPDKDPMLRMRMLDEAGVRKVPFTTGILLGIGETPAERAQSLLAIRQSHELYGHIQEVIIQNFRAKPDIPMADAPEPSAGAMVRAIATARLVLGPAMNVQAPPNLSPNEIEVFLQAGINDWGGISPLSKDYVNPEAPWPHLEALARRCARAGFHLKQRLAIYPEFIKAEWVDPAMMPPITRLRDELSLEA
jgi:7,8-didemethyl-8-hydroxy-5-deazariboflavin synthase CofG subunit